MASEQYLERVAYTIRKHRSDPNLDMELEALIAECQADLHRAGVPEERANDESDPLILGAVRCYVRWKFPYQLDPNDANRLREEYYTMLDNIRKSPRK